jgi:U-box domain
MDASAVPVQQPPPEFLCPITMEVMVHPLATKHGPNFERSAIVAWLRQGSGECPLTRKPLTMSDLIHNNYLAAEIAQWRATHGIPVPQQLLTEAIDTQSRTFCHVQDDCSDVNNDLDAVDLVRLQHIYGTTMLPFDTVIPATHGSVAESSTRTTTLSPTRADAMPPTTTSISRPRLKAFSPRKLWPTSLTPRRRFKHIQVSTPAC